MGGARRQLSSSLAFALLHRTTDINKIFKRYLGHFILELSMNNKKHAIIDKTVSVVSTVFPFTALPQIYNIWILKDAQGVSLLTWLLFLLLGIPLFLYAIIHKDKRLQVMFGLWCAVYFLAVVGLLIYQ